VERLASAGDRVVSLATSDDTVWLLVERRVGTMGATAKYRLLSSDAREFERDLNTAAQDSFRLAADAPFVEYQGRYLALLEQFADPSPIQYVVTKRMLFRERPMWHGDLRQEEDTAGELRKYTAEGYQPLLLIAGIRCSSLSSDKVA
jgi:hypothetical protein